MTDRVRRVYLPVSTSAMTAMERDRELGGDPAVGFAVTEALTASLPSAEDEEGQEYASLQEAAAYAADHGLRVIAAADLDIHQIEQTATLDAGAPDVLARVEVLDGVPRRRIVSLHVLDPVDERDPAGDFELSWYDVTELAEVLRSVS